MRAFGMTSDNEFLVLFILPSVEDGIEEHYEPPLEFAMSTFYNSLILSSNLFCVALVLAAVTLTISESSDA